MYSVFGQVSDAQDDTSFKAAINTEEVLDCLDIIGYNSVPKFETKETIVRDVCQFGSSILW